MTIPAPATLRLLLVYDADTGALTWRTRAAELFPAGKHSAERQAAAWNARMAGRPALAADRRGYLVGSIFNRRYAAHRVCWAIFYGAWPEGQIDHIDGNPSNNRISNLRSVDNATNGKNQRIGKNNSTGVNGVLFDRGKFVARIKVNGVSKHLGRFSTLDDAAAARARANIEFGFHPNHGAIR